MEHKFCYKIAAEAGWVIDEKGNKCECPIEATIDLPELTVDDYDGIHRILMKDRIAEITQEDPAHIIPISTSEYRSLTNDYGNIENLNKVHEVRN